jgi:ABC-2 type transport system permease protein
VTNREDLLNLLVPAEIFLIVLLFMRGAKLPGTNFSLGSGTLPSVLGAGLIFSGLLGMAGQLAVERETAPCCVPMRLPNGMAGYLIGKVCAVSAVGLAGMLLTLIPSLCLFDGLAENGLSSWLTLVWVLVVRLFATMPIGAVVGSLMPNSRSLGLVMLPILGLTAISGIFYPISSLPQWLQEIAQVFPMYWLWLGMRSALLPDPAVVVEIVQFWHHLETLGVLAVWAVIGLTLAPTVLRRTARASPCPRWRYGRKRQCSGLGRS